VPLRRLVVLISVIVCVDTAFYAAVAPLLPHYSDDFGLSKFSAGVLTAAFPAGVIAGSLPSGYIASRIGPRATVVLGLAVIATASVVFGLAQHIALLDGARFVQGLGSACAWTGGLSWLTTAAPPERRGAVIGTALGAAIAGALLGPLVGGLADVTDPLAVFVGVGVLATLLAILAALMPAAERAERQAPSGVRAVLRVPRVRTAMWLMSLPAIGFGTLGVLVPLRLDELGWSGVAVAAAFLVSAGFESAESAIVGRISDTRGRLVPVRAGLACAGVLLLVMPLPGTGVLVALTFMATALSLGAFWAPAMALLSDLAEELGVAQGMAFALMNLAWGLGQAFGGVAGGGLAKLTSDAVPFGLCAAGCLVTLGALRRVPELGEPVEAVQ
jgi:MFS family permease